MNGHVGGLEYGVGKVVIGVGVGGVVVCQTCGRSFSRVSGLKRHSCDSVRSKKISVSGR